MAYPGTFYSFGMVGGSRLVVGKASIGTSGATWDMCESDMKVKAILGVVPETQGQTPSAKINASNDYQIDVDNSATGVMWASAIVTGD